MEGAELIIQEINREAEQKIQYILSEAQREAEKIKEEARKRAEDRPSGYSGKPRHRPRWRSRGQ